MRATERDEQVLEVVLAEHGAAELDRPRRCLDLGADPGARYRVLGRQDLGFASRTAGTAEDRDRNAGCELGSKPVIDMNDGVPGPELGEEARLGFGVALHGLVEVQVIAREVRERGHLEVECIGPMHREAMTGHLEHQVRRPIVERLPSEARDVVAFRGGVKRWALATRAHEPCRSYQCGLARCAFDRLLQEIRRRRLAVGTRNPNGVQGAGRLAVHELGGAPKSHARVWYRNLRNVMSQRLLGHHGNGAARQCILDEADAVVGLSRHRNEQISARHLTRVVLHTAHRLRRQTRDPAPDTAAL